MDVRLPNGTILKNVPEGTSKDEIATKAIKAGLATPQEMFNPTEGMSNKGINWGDISKLSNQGINWLDISVVK